MLTQKLHRFELTIARRSAKSMLMDFAYVALTLVLFALALGLIRVCERV
jgi:hypothetical protein